MHIRDPLNSTACDALECFISDKPTLVSGAFAVYIHNIDGRPFSAIVRDMRNDTHLHMPARDVLAALPRKVRNRIALERH